MRVLEINGNVITLAATRGELGTIVAAARMALDMVIADAAAPPAAGDRLSAVLRDYDTAVARAIIAHERP